jgi:hypothetical protein
MLRKLTATFLNGAAQLLANGTHTYEQALVLAAPVENDAEMRKRRPITPRK